MGCHYFTIKYYYGAKSGIWLLIKIQQPTKSDLTEVHSLSILWY